jgi:hypothetical protein
MKEKSEEISLFQVRGARERSVQRTAGVLTEIRIRHLLNPSEKLPLKPTCSWANLLGDDNNTDTTTTIYLSTYLRIYGSPVLLLDLGRFFNFIILYTVGRTPWTGVQPVARPLPAHRTLQTQNKRTQTSMPWVGFELTIPTFKRAKTFHALDRERPLWSAYHHYYIAIITVKTAPRCLCSSNTQDLIRNLDRDTGYPDRFFVVLPSPSR